MAKKMPPPPGLAAPTAPPREDPAWLQEEKLARQASGGLTKLQRQYQSKYGDKWQDQYNADDRAERQKLGMQAVNFLQEKVGAMTPQAPQAAPPGLASPAGQRVADIATGLNPRPGMVATDLAAKKLSGEGMDEANSYVRGTNQDTNDAYARLGQLRRYQAGPMNAPPGLSDRISAANATMQAGAAARMPAPIPPESAGSMLARANGVESRLAAMPTGADYRAPTLDRFAPTGAAHPMPPGLASQMASVQGARAAGMPVSAFQDRQMAQQGQQAQIDAQRAQTANIGRPSPVDAAKAGFFDAQAQAARAKAGFLDRSNPNQQRQAAPRPIGPNPTLVAMKAADNDIANAEAQLATLMNAKLDTAQDPEAHARKVYMAKIQVGKMKDRRAALQQQYRTEFGQQGQAPAGQPAAAPQQAGGQPVQVSSFEDVDRLPSGTRFITPDGRIKIKG